MQRLPPARGQVQRHIHHPPAWTKRREKHSPKFKSQLADCPYCHIQLSHTIQETQKNGEERGEKQNEFWFCLFFNLTLLPLPKQLSTSKLHIMMTAKEISLISWRKKKTQDLESTELNRMPVHQVLTVARKLMGTVCMESSKVHIHTQCIMYIHIHKFFQLIVYIKCYLAITL